MFLQASMINTMFPQTPAGQLHARTPNNQDKNEEETAPNAQMLSHNVTHAKRKPQKRNFMNNACSNNMLLPTLMSNTLFPQTPAG